MCNDAIRRKSILEAEIDHLVYALYGQTKGKFAVVEGKR